MKTIRRYEFGDFYYEFEILAYVMPHGREIHTILVSMSNVFNLSDSDPILSDLIRFLANICVEFDTICDSYHCRISPYESDRLEEIIESINELAASIGTNTYTK
jgi:hypothetical protein